MHRSAADRMDAAKVEQAERKRERGEAEAGALCHEKYFFLKRQFKWIVVELEFCARSLFAPVMPIFFVIGWRGLYRSIARRHGC